MQHSAKYRVLRLARLLVVPALLLCAFVKPTDAAAQEPMQEPVNADVDSVLNVEIAVPVEPEQDPALYSDEEEDSPTNVVTFDDMSPAWREQTYFNPDPNRALWLSVLCPGLGQIYNRRYWKLPIIVGGFMGLGYATGWNNGQLTDYMQAYRDATDDDPNTKSYMNFFPPTTTEDQLDKAWLQQTLKSRKDYYRRNRDLCIISLVGLYLLCMVDAYVDASLAHFDISDNLSLDLHPAIIIDSPYQKPAWGLTWALSF